jgi:hypothetical protein
MNTIGPGVTGRKAGGGGEAIAGLGHNRGPSLDVDDLRTWPPDWLPYITLAEVEKLTTLSHDTIARKYRRFIARLSSRRIGMRRGHAILITELKADSTS